MSLKILIVDDDEAIRTVLQSRLRNWEYDVCLACDGAEARKLAQSYDPDVIVSDVMMPDMSGIDLLAAIVAEDAGRHVILITCETSCDLAVEAMKQGAFTVLPKPLEYSRLREMLVQIERELNLRPNAQSGAAQKRGTGLIGTSPAMLAVNSLIRSISDTDVSVLITGESGTGKELAAAAIHNRSRRSARSFLSVNAAAIPETLMESEMFGHEKGAFTGAESRRAGCFEMANRGTLFLDEIGEMPLGLQVKLLRVLESQRVRRLGGSQEFAIDVRVLAATNRDPERAVADGQLREDLYYRLNVFGLKLPALRDRPDDLPLLIRHFLAEFERKYRVHTPGIREDAMAQIYCHTWPGNVRELRNALERAVILAHGGWIERAHLPKDVLSCSPVHPEPVALVI